MKVNDLSSCSCMDSPIVLYVYIAGDHSLGLPVILMWMRYFVNFDNLYSLLPYIAPSHWLPTLEAQMLHTQVHPFPRHQSCREVICQSSWNRTPETVLPRRLLCNGSHRNQAGNATRLEGPLYVHTRQGTRLDKKWTLGCVKFPPAAIGGQGIHASSVLLSGPTLLQASPTSNLAYVIGHPV